MSKRLGVNGYALKHTIMSFVTAAAPDLDLPQRLAGHTSNTHTRRYTAEPILAANLEAVSKTILPQLHSRFGEY